MVAALLVATIHTSAGQIPQRVLSMNVCTDQSAMLVAAKGQLISVSYLASDPKMSALADEAKSYAVNHGLAEEIFLMKPDLVLAGSFSTRATVALLQRLGFQVEEFQPATSFAGIRTHLRRMGQLLGRQAKAEAIISDMDRSLSAQTKPAQSKTAQSKTARPKTAALYYANSYTAGGGTLMDEVVHRAGLINLADQQGIVGSVRMPLENLIMAKPDLLVAGEGYSKPALAFESYTHPALQKLMAETPHVTLPSNLMVCGGPFTVKAVEILAEAMK